MIAPRSGCLSLNPSLKAVVTQAAKNTLLAASEQVAEVLHCVTFSLIIYQDYYLQSWISEWVWQCQVFISSWWTVNSVISSLENTGNILIIAQFGARWKRSDFQGGMSYNNSSVQTSLSDSFKVFSNCGWQVEKAIWFRLCWCERHNEEAHIPITSVTRALRGVKVSALQSNDLLCLISSKENLFGPTSGHSFSSPCYFEPHFLILHKRSSVEVPFQFHRHEFQVKRQRSSQLKVELDRKKQPTDQPKPVLPLTPLIYFDMA